MVRYLYDKIKTKKFTIVFFIISAILSTIFITVAAIHDVPLERKYSDSSYNDILTIANGILNGANITEIEEINVPGKVSLLDVTKEKEGGWTYRFEYKKDEYNLCHSNCQIYRLTVNANGTLIDSNPNISSKEAFMQDQQINMLIQITILDVLIAIIIGGLAYIFLIGISWAYKENKKDEK